MPTILEKIEILDSWLDRSLPSTIEEKRDNFSRISGKNYIKAVKFVRMGFDCSLCEAKHLVDGIINQDTREIWDNLVLIIQQHKDIETLRIANRNLEYLASNLQNRLVKKNRLITELQTRLSEGYEYDENDEDDIPF